MCMEIATSPANTAPFEDVPRYITYYIFIYKCFKPNANHSFYLIELYIVEFIIIYVRLCVCVGMGMGEIT